MSSFRRSSLKYRGSKTETKVTAIPPKKGTRPDLEVIKISSPIIVLKLMNQLIKLIDVMFPAQMLYS